jgi:hypothetical protein
MLNILGLVIFTICCCSASDAKKKQLWGYGGRLQLKAAIGDVTNTYREREILADVRRFTLDGFVNPSEKIHGEVSVHADTWNNFVGFDEAFIQWIFWRRFSIKAGNFRKPFSMEELTSTQSLWTIEKSLLYNQLLKRQNGYAGFDLGLGVSMHSRKKLFGCEFGLFKGIPRKNGYLNENSNYIERGFDIWDGAFRLTLKPFSSLLLEASASVRSVKNPASAFLDISIDPVFQTGFRWVGAALRVQGEVAGGGNHRGSDLEIPEHHPNFLAFYLMPAYVMKFSGEKSLEWVFRWEGQDPGWSFRDSVVYKNDASFYYTLGVSYLIRTWLSFQFNYGFRQPVTSITHQRKLGHTLELMLGMKI